MLDCLIIGGGPAGLTAAIYLARFRLSVALVDAGQGRARMIPIARNHAGFPDGIAGRDLIARMAEQASRYGARVDQDRILKLARDGDTLIGMSDARNYRARSILLATGVSNNRPDMPADVHDEAVAKGLLRYCPICDGFEVTDRRVGVIGTGEHGVREAMFLRSYTKDLALISPAGRHSLSDRERVGLRDVGVAITDGPATVIAIEGDRIELRCAAGLLSFDALYPALGSVIHSDLAKDLGAAMSPDGCLLVDKHQRTDAKGLYAAGDVVFGLDQISHAMGEGGVAATTIRNDLAALDPLIRA